MMNPVSETLTGIPVLVRVAETQSFSEAARQLGMSASGVSKAISRLEERLGVRLFDRTTRKVAATEEGERFYQRCRLILADVEEAQTELTETQVQPRGSVLASVPTALGRRHIVPALPDLLRLHPHLEVKLELTDRKVDLVGERVDVAVRIGGAPSNSRGRLVHRPIADSQVVLCASPSYVQLHGAPRRPQDLAAHNVYFYGSHRGVEGRTWQFERGDERQVVAVSGNVTLDSGDALVELARIGDGVIAVFDFLASRAIHAGELQVLLPNWQLWQSQSISLVYPKHRRHSVKVMAFADFVEGVVSNALAPGACTKSPAASR
jgi:LysR family transcriptional regulator, regulator for bpeEF and oprC